MGQGSLQLCCRLSHVPFRGTAHLNRHCLLSTSRVFVLFRAYFLAELPPCWGWLMLSPWSWPRVLRPALEQQTCPGGWELARCASLDFGSGEGEGGGEKCLSFLPAPLWQPCELRSSWNHQKKQFCPQVPGLKGLRYSPTGWK